MSGPSWSWKSKFPRTLPTEPFSRLGLPMSTQSSTLLDGSRYYTPGTQRRLSLVKGSVHKTPFPYTGRPSTPGPIDVPAHVHRGPSTYHPPHRGPSKYHPLYTYHHPILGSVHVLVHHTDLPKEVGTTCPPGCDGPGRETQCPNDGENNGKDPDTIGSTGSRRW